MWLNTWRQVTPKIKDFISFCAYWFRQAWVCWINPRDNIACKIRTPAQVYAIIIAMAAAGAISPASSIFITATDASVVSDEYKKMTAETVVMAFKNKYMETSKIAGVQTGTVTRKNVL